MTKVLSISIAFLVLLFALFACSSGTETPVDGDCTKIPIVDVTQTWPVVPTGLTTCYNDYDEIPCPVSGEPFYGQDAQYPDNLRTFSEVDLSGDTVVEDSLTGLVWAEPMAGKLIWTEALDYCETLDYADFDDWRLPNIHELHSLATYTGDNHDNELPEIDLSTQLWSSTPYLTPEFPYEDFLIYDSENNTATCDEQKRVWALQDARAITMKSIVGKISFLCVRREQPTGFQADRFTETRAAEPNQTDWLIEDSTSGLMWPQTYEDTICWSDALAYCEDLRYGGFADWRLPNINELISLVNFGKTGPASDFPDLLIKQFWSSTSTSAGSAWYLRTGDGKIETDGYRQNEDAGHCYNAALCVRGGL